MESELDAVKRRAKEYAKKHPEFIREDADILKEDKPKRGAKPGNKNAVKKGLPTFNAQKVLDADKKVEVEQFNNQLAQTMNKVITASHHIDSSQPERSSRTNAVIRSALRARWLDFLNKPVNTNKSVNQARADFIHEIFLELGI
jgi:hypothetical protein